MKKHYGSYHTTPGEAFKSLVSTIASTKDGTASRVVQFALDEVEAAMSRVQSDSIKLLAARVHKESIYTAMGLINARKKFRVAIERPDKYSGGARFKRGSWSYVSGCLA